MDKKTYSTWTSMKHRCGPKATGKTRELYFAAGIRVCERWKKFASFLEDMGPRPEGKSLDRFPDGRGNYEPGNCRWATSSEQNKNRRPFVPPSPCPVTYQGRTQSIRDWERELGLPKNLLNSRIRQHGWDLERAMTTPSLRPRQAKP